LLYSEARVSGSGAGAPAQVKALCLFVAESCNLSCRYCFVQQNRLKPAKALMSAEVGSAAVDFLIEASGDRRRCEIDFFGGEPLLNWPVLREITAYARQKSAARGKEFAFTLTTNGELLTPQLAAYLEEEGFAAVLSLDGRSAVHDRMRFIPGEGGSYQRVLPRVLSYVSSNPRGGYSPGTSARPLPRLLGALPLRRRLPGGILLKRGSGRTISSRVRAAAQKTGMRPLSACRQKRRALNMAPVYPCPEEVITDQYERK